MLTTIFGPMFAEKTTEVLRRIRRALRAHKVVQVWLPSIDTRSAGEIKTHAGDVSSVLGVKVHIAETSQDILDGLNESADLVIIDEIQFFDAGILEVLDSLRQHREVVVAGLPVDNKGRSFGQMHQIISMSDRLIKLTAICAGGKDATHTIRVTPVVNNQWVGGAGDYDSVCFRCWLNHQKA